MPVMMNIALYEASRQQEHGRANQGEDRNMLAGMQRVKGCEGHDATEQNNRYA